jgi:putative ABC transport system permease protein
MLNAELETVAGQLAALDPAAYKSTHLTAVPLHNKIAGASRVPLLGALGTAAFLLLVACVNVANLFMARSTSRQREFAIRSALGAGRLRVVRQLFTETLLYSLAGGLLGTAVGVWMVRGFVALGPKYIPRLDQVVVDWRVLAVAFVATAGAALFCAVAPAIQSSRTNIVAGLRSGPGSAQHLKHWRRPASLLIASELALTTVLALAGGLFTHNFIRVIRTDLGFDPDGVMAFSIAQSPSPSRASGSRSTRPADRKNPVAMLDDADRTTARLRSELANRLARLPGVLGAGYTTNLPLTGMSGRSSLVIDGWPDRGRGVPMAQVSSAGPGYFRTLGMTLKTGRWFTEADREGTPRVALVNETVAAKYWPRQNPVGKRVVVGWSPATVVGVVADARHFGPLKPGTPELYLPDTQEPKSWAFLLVKSSLPRAALETAVTREWQALDPGGSVAAPRALDDLLSDVVAVPRMAATVIGGFGLFALLLAAMGVHGVLRYSVAQRIQEIRIRSSLGGSPGRIVRLVVGQTIAWAGAGIAIGCGAAMVLGGAVRSALVGITPADAVTWVCVITGLPVAVTVAAIGPANQATRVDPVTALRRE